MKYSFLNISHCNMCGDTTKHHKILGKRLNKQQGKNPKNKIGVSTTVMRCSNCSLIYSNPQPIPEDIQDHYGVPPENYWKEDYFNIEQSYFKEQINTFNKLKPIEKGMKALDIGAGLGKCMIALKDAGFDVYGFEPSEPFYERAVSKMGIKPEQLKIGMMEDIDYPIASFDFITFGAVLEHLYDPNVCITKALKWLKPGGLIHIEVPSSDWLINKIGNLYYRLRGTDYVANISPMHTPYHLHEFTPKSFNENAIINKYKVVYYKYYVCQTYLPAILDSILKPYMKATKKGMQLEIWLSH